MNQYPIKKWKVSGLFQHSFFTHKKKRYRKFYGAFKKTFKEMIIQSLRDLQLQAEKGREGKP